MDNMVGKIRDKYNTLKLVAQKRDEHFRNCEQCSSSFKPYCVIGKMLNEEVEQAGRLYTQECNAHNSRLQTRL